MPRSGQEVAARLALYHALIVALAVLEEVSPVSALQVCDDLLAGILLLLFQPHLLYPSQKVY